MKTMFLTSILALIALASTAIGQPDNTLGLYFNEAEFGDEVSHIVTPDVPFTGAIVLLAPTQETIGGYEVGITIPEPAVFVAGSGGPNGWINVGGSNLNHIVGFQTPVPVDGNGTVLGEITLLYTADSPVPIYFGPADPPSLPDVPAVADGADPTLLFPCNLFAEDGLVAELNPSVAVQARSLTRIRALFD
jgi:hypothetical protein